MWCGVVWCGVCGCVVVACVCQVLEMNFFTDSSDPGPSDEPQRRLTTRYGVKGRQNLTHVHACAVLVLGIISVSVRVRKT